MKILILSHMYPNKKKINHGIFVHEQIKEFIAQGCTVKVISPVPWVPHIFKKIKKSWTTYTEIPSKDVIEGVEIYYPRYINIPGGFCSEISGLLMYLGINKLISKIFQSQKFDIIHSHTILPDTACALYLKKKYQLPLVATVHGADLQQSIHKSALVKKKIINVIEKTDKTILVSNKLKNILESIYKPSNNRLEVINNGIDLTKTKQINNKNLLKQYENNFILLSVANLQKIKGHEYVLKVLSKLTKEHNNLNIRYLIIGDGEEKQNLMNLTETLNLQKFVEFLGVKTNQEVFNYISISNIFVLPSYKEGFGVVYLEAMSLGKPAIGCKTQGIEDCIENNETGFLVEPHNINELYDCINNLISNHQLVEEVGNNAKNHIKNNFTWKNNVEKTLKIYTTIKQSKKRA